MPQHLRQYGPDFHGGDEEEEIRHDSDNEPGEDDLVTFDHVHFYEGGKRVLSIAGGSDASEQSMWRQLEAHMKKQNYWPNVWFVSDHGNAHVMTKPRRARKR